MLETSMDNLVSMLESATAETDKLVVMNESSTTVSRIIDAFTKIAGTFAEIESMRVPSSEIDELRATISKVRRITITDDFRILTYPKIHEFQDNYSLNITYLFDYVLGEIKKHSENPDGAFDQDLINKQAIAHALKQCTGKFPSKTLDLNGFKYHYQLSVFGGFRKVNILPNTIKLCNNALRVPLTLKFIDTKLIYRHISSLNKFQTDLTIEFKKLQDSSPAFGQYMTRYLNAISIAIQNTLSIYKIMRSTYYMLKIEYDRILKFIISKERQLRSYPMTESCLVETAAFIAASTKPLREISSKINLCLNESTNTELQTDQRMISESLTNFITDLKERVHSEADLRRELRHKYLVQMGPVLLKIPDNDFKDDNQYQAYDAINNVLDISTLINQFSKNIDFLKDILEHCDKYRNQTVKFYITNFLPFNMQSCIPDSDINLIGVLLTNISSKICGTYRYINPDIEKISQNVVSIPNLMGLIDSHINNITDLVEKSISDVSNRSFSSIEEQKMVIDNITNAFFAYLAIILNIYKNLSIIEESALSTVTAISDAADSIPCKN